MAVHVSKGFTNTTSNILNLFQIITCELLGPQLTMQCSICPLHNLDRHTQLQHAMSTLCCLCASAAVSAVSLLSPLSLNDVSFRSLYCLPLLPPCSPARIFQLASLSGHPSCGAHTSTLSLLLVECENEELQQHADCQVL